MATPMSARERERAGDQLFALGEGQLAKVREDHVRTAQKRGESGRKLGIEDLDEWASSFVGALSSRASELSTEYLTLKGALPGARGFFGMNLLTTAVALGIFALALAIDYAILHHFWTGVLADQFGVVPKGLKDDVLLKSGQVLIAVLAMHFFQEYWGRTGRMVFAGVLWSIVIVVVLGFGFLISKGSLPIGSSFGGVSLSESITSAEDELSSIFGGSGGVAATAESDGADQAIKSTETAVFMIVVSLVFFLVTSVGAFSLHYVLNGWRGLTNSFVGHERSKGIERLNYQLHRRKMIGAWLYRVENGKLGWSLLDGHLSRLLAVYSHSRDARLIRLPDGVSEHENLGRMKHKMLQEDWSDEIVSGYFSGMSAEILPEDQGLRERRRDRLENDDNVENLNDWRRGRTGTDD